MRLCRVNPAVGRQRGITVVELLVAIAIVGLISAGIATLISQIITGNTRTSNHMIAVRQVQQAGKDVSQDTLQAQEIIPGPNDGFPLLLRWTDIGGVANNITYTIAESGELLRTHVRDPGDSDSRVIARYIAAASVDVFGSIPECDPPCYRGLTLEVMAIVGDGPYQASETREYTAERRPD